MLSGKNAMSDPVAFVGEACGGGRGGGGDAGGGGGNGDKCGGSVKNYV